MKDPKCITQNCAVAFLIFHFAFLTTSCGVPNLESAECGEARVAVKRFYSFHFDNYMHPSSENLRLRRGFLTDALYNELRSANLGNTDYFTKSDEFPRTFKVGKCVHFPDSSRLSLQVQLYWRDDQKAVQKELFIIAHRRDNALGNEGWLIDKVVSEQPKY